jgi:hypothetical protein
MNLAWVLQDSGQKEEAEKIWPQLVNVQDIYVKSAACWFLGENALEHGDKKMADELFSRVSDHASESKFANYCLNSKNQLEGKDEKNN